MKKLKSNYAAIVATLALVVALVGVPGVTAGGILVTSKQIKNGSILTQDIHKAAVQSSDIGKGAVGSADIKTGGVQSADIGAGQVDSSDIGAGQVTPEDVTMPDPKQLQESDAASAKVGTEFTKVDEVGTYTKEDGGSILEVNWTGTAVGVEVPCIFQIRVDGQPSAVGAGATYVGTDPLSVSVTSIFAGLPAGPHLIEVWAHLTHGPDPANCTVGPAAAGISQTFVISEQIL